MELSQVIKKKVFYDLAKQYGKVSQEQGENSAEAQKLRQEYNKQANELNFLEKELEEKTTTEFEEFKKLKLSSKDGRKWLGEKPVKFLKVWDLNYKNG